MKILVQVLLTAAFASPAIASEAKSFYDNSLYTDGANIHLDIVPQDDGRYALSYSITRLSPIDGVSTQTLAIDDMKCRFSEVEISCVSDKRYVDGPLQVVVGQAALGRWNFTLSSTSSGFGGPATTRVEILGNHLKAAH